MKSSIIVLAVAALMLLCTTLSPAYAQEVKLKFTTLNPPNAPINTLMMHKWANHINEQGKGVVSIQVIDGYAIANYRDWYDLLLNDVVQLSFGTSDIGGRFKKVTVPQIPFLVKKSAPASVALWRLYESGLLNDEFKQVIPLMFVIFPATSPHYREEPKSIANFDGLKIIGGSRVTSQLIQALGGAPVTFPPADQYEALQRHTADAIFSNFSALASFKMDEVTHYHVNVDFTGGVGMVAMSRARYDVLPEAARKIIAANATEKDSDEFGTFFDNYEKTSRETIAHEPNQKVVLAPPEVLERWETKARPIEEGWVKENDGAAVLPKYKQLLAEAQNGH